MSESLFAPLSLVDVAPPTTPAPSTPIIVRGPSDLDGTRPDSLDPGLRLITVERGPMLTRSEHFLYDIYIESGFCAVSPRRMVEELDPWRAFSTFHIVHDERRTVIGSVRTITGSVASLPVGAFELTEEVGPGPVVELSSLAVAPTSRSSGVVEHIYRAGWLAALRAGASELVALVDPWLLDLFIDHYQLPFRRIGVPHFHMGGDVVPVAMSLRGPAYAGLAANRQGFWEWTLEACSDEEIRAWNLPPARV